MKAPKDPGSGKWNPSAVEYDPHHYRFPRSLRELGLSDDEVRQRWGGRDRLMAWFWVVLIVVGIFLVPIVDRLGG